MDFFRKCLNFFAIFFQNHEMGGIFTQSVLKPNHEIVGITNSEITKCGDLLYNKLETRPTWNFFDDDTNAYFFYFNRSSQTTQKETRSPAISRLMPIGCWNIGSNPASWNSRIPIIKHIIRTLWLYIFCHTLYIHIYMYIWSFGFPRKKVLYSKAPIIRTRHWAVLAVHSMYCNWHTYRYV